MEPPFRKELGAEAEAEESSLLEAVTRERMVKTQQARKDLACAVLIGKVWRLAMALLITCNYELRGKVVNKFNLRSKILVDGHTYT
jgi:hypothetical protein